MFDQVPIVRFYYQKSDWPTPDSVDLICRVLGMAGRQNRGPLSYPQSGRTVSHSLSYQKYVETCSTTVYSKCKWGLMSRRQGLFLGGLRKWLIEMAGISTYILTDKMFLRDHVQSGPSGMIRDSFVE